MKPEDYVGPKKIMRLLRRFARASAEHFLQLFPVVITIYYLNRMDFQGETTNDLAVSVCKSFGPELLISDGFTRYLIQ